MQPDNKQTFCGFVAIVGAPNSGKSTFLNTVVNEKVSIVSSKCQTTRSQIKGILQLRNSVQIIFIDTPGFCSAKTPLEKALLSNFKCSYKYADIILVVIDAFASFQTLHKTYDFIKKLGDKRIVVVINKIDKPGAKNKILGIADSLRSFQAIEKIFMVSVLKNDGASDVIDYLADNIPEGPFLYNPEDRTDLSVQFRLSEITREKIFRILSDELPYSIYVETELFRTTEKKAFVYQAIVVNKSSQKGIVLGSRGSMIKKVKDLAIIDMKALLNKKVELKLFVKVEENWTENRSQLQSAGIINN